MSKKDEQSRIVFQYASNPRIFEWNEMVDAIIHNLGKNVSTNVVHFAIDIKAAMQYIGERHADYKNGLIVDPALSIDLEASYPEEDREDLEEYVFFRAFCIDSDNPEEISSWVNERFIDPPSYIWVNGKMVGGLNFPQEEGSEERTPPLKEELSEFVCYRPNR
jgi:hypothetical protein